MQGGSKTRPHPSPPNLFRPLVCGAGLLASLLPGEARRTVKVSRTRGGAWWGSHSPPRPPSESPRRRWHLTPPPPPPVAPASEGGGPRWRLAERAHPYLRQNREAALGRRHIHAAMVPRHSRSCQRHAGHCCRQGARARHATPAGSQPAPQPRAPGRQPDASGRRHFYGSAPSRPSTREL